MKPSEPGSPSFGTDIQTHERYLTAGLDDFMLTGDGQMPLLADATADPVMAALSFFAKLYNLPFTTTSEYADRSVPSMQRARQTMEANHWRVRSVHLGPDVHTWHTERVLGFWKADGQPVIVCPCGEESYCIDPLRGQRLTLDAARLTEIEPEALRIYELLPLRPTTWREVAAFTLRDSRTLWRDVVLLSLLCGLLGLLQPLATEYVTGTLIPTANNSGLWQLMVVLMVLTCSEALLRVAPTLRFIAFSAQRSERFEAAVLDRLFRLPIKFFRAFDSGDLGMRVLSISNMHEIFIRLLSTQFMSMAFTVVSMGMLLYYSWKLCLVGLSLTLVYCVLMLLLLRSTLPYLSESAAGRGRMASFLKQTFEGMSIIKLCGAEHRILRRFLAMFLIVSKAGYSTQICHDRLKIMGVIFPAANSLLFYWLVGDVWRSSLSMPQYLAFMAAFAGFQQGIVGLCGAMWSLWQLEPERRRLTPILEETTEQPAGLADPGILDGTVEVSRVTFRYAAHLPPTLVDVSLEAKPGEFIGIVGPSGAGKSSIMRLLVGFEQPESGGVFYNGKNLDGLRLHSVRRQLGCILQGSHIMPGPILNAITAGTNFTLDDAMEAARLAGLDKDIENMPMGIHTVVSEGLLSGGQVQRLLLARALVGRPQILLLDEATSALDNVTQGRVWANLKLMRSTRIVIAHRLSTIVEADRIYVIDQGRVSDSGTYDELMRRDGVFRKLAQRQLL